MTRLIALAGMATYVCQVVVNHDGKDLPVGSPIELDTDAAQQLLNVQAIGHSDGNTLQALQPGQVEGLIRQLDREETKLLDEMAAELLSAAQALEAADARNAELQGTVDQLRQSAESSRIAAAGAVEGLQGELGAEKLKVTELEAANQQLRDDATAAGQAHAAELEKLNKKLADATKAATTGTKTKRT